MAENAGWKGYDCVIDHQARGPSMQSHSCREKLYLDEFFV